MPGGMVSFTADGNSLGAACTNITVTKGQNNSTAVCTISVANNNLLAPGAHIIVATYSDDANYGPGDLAQLHAERGQGDADGSGEYGQPERHLWADDQPDGDGDWCARGCSAWRDGELHGGWQLAGGIHRHHVNQGPEQQHGGVHHQRRQQ